MYLCVHVTYISIIVRFSTVGGESGSADTARDPRGFAVKFYTQQGEYINILFWSHILYFDDTCIIIACPLNNIHEQNENDM